jgi:hypothetical protein
MLPLIGLFLTASVVAISLTREMVPLLLGPKWAMVTTPITSAFHPNWAPYILLSTFASILTVAGAIALLVLAFRKHPRFPLGMVIYYLALVPFWTIDLWAYSTFLNQVAPDEVRAHMPEVIARFSLSIVSCLVWIPYFLTSKRVKNTFAR